MDVETYLKQKRIFFTFLELFLHFFSTLHSVKTIKVYFFFNELALKNWAMNMHFNPIHILYGLFLGGGGAWDAPPSYT